MHSLRRGFLRLRQNNARGGRGFKLGLTFLVLVLRFAAALIVVATPVAAKAVFQAELSGLSLGRRGNECGSSSATGNGMVGLVGVPSGFECTGEASRPALFSGEGDWSPEGEGGGYEGEYGVVVL